MVNNIDNDIYFDYKSCNFKEFMSYMSNLNKLNIILKLLTEKFLKKFEIDKVYIFFFIYLK